MKVKIISVETLRERSSTFDMLLRNEKHLYSVKERKLTLNDCHQQFIEEQLYGFYDTDAIAALHENFVQSLSDPEACYGRIMSTFNMKFLVVVLDYYCVHSWSKEIVNFVAGNEKVYWNVFNELLVMSFVDNGHVEIFKQQVDSKKHYRPMPPFQPFEKRRQSARSFAEITAAIGTYADRK